MSTEKEKIILLTQNLSKEKTACVKKGNDLASRVSSK